MQVLRGRSLIQRSVTECDMFDEPQKGGLGPLAGCQERKLHKMYICFIYK